MVPYKTHTGSDMGDFSLFYEGWRSIKWFYRITFVFCLLMLIETYTGSDVGDFLLFYEGWRSMKWFYRISFVFCLLFCFVCCFGETSCCCFWWDFFPCPLVIGLSDIIQWIIQVNSCSLTFCMFLWLYKLNICPFFVRCLYRKLSLVYSLNFLFLKFHR